MHLTSVVDMCNMTESYSCP